MTAENLKQRKEDNLDLLKNHLVEALQYSDEDLIRDLNADLIVLMTEDMEFKVSLEKALYNNEQKITNKKFQLQDKEEKPTVGNWLKHFIKEEGTEKFDKVTLSKFLAESENAKRLDAEERKMIRKLFNLYRNLKFFPDSIRKSDPHDWEIFPFEDQRNNNDGERAPEKQYDKTQRPSLSDAERKSRGAVDRAEELKRYKEKYTEGSLERKAIEGEIERLEKRKQ
jgi:hypothetical protein